MCSDFRIALHGMLAPLIDFFNRTKHCPILTVLLNLLTILNMYVFKCFCVLADLHF